MVALDLSGRPYFAHDLQLAGVRVGEFDADLTPHFLRSLATQSGMTLHVRLLAGSDAPSHRRGRLQGVRPGALAGLRAARARRRGAVHQGHALTAARGPAPRVAVVDYGMGNLASVAKALARSGADVRVTQSAAGVRDAAGVVLPGVGAFRDAAARLERERPGGRRRPAYRGRHAVSRRLPRPAAPLREQRRGRPLAGPRRARRDGRAPQHRPQGAAHRLERPRLGAGRRGHGPRAAGPGHRLLRALLRRRSGGPGLSSPPRPTTAARSSPQWRATTSGRYSSTRRRVRASGSPCWPRFVANVHREAHTP